MNDEFLQQLLKQADERLQAAVQPAQDSGTRVTAFVETVRRQRARQVRRRTGLGVVAVLVMVGGLSAWSLNAGLWNGADHLPDAIASKSVEQPNRAAGATASKAPAKDGRLNDEEIARLKAEIAALDAEANAARRFVQLYRAAESRRERLAAAEAVSIEPLLPPQVVAELEIDRAAAIAVISADVQENEFERSDEAAESYRSVLKNFPHSRWASVAKQRLVQIEQMN